MNRPIHSNFDERGALSFQPTDHTTRKRHFSSFQLPMLYTLLKPKKMFYATRACAPFELLTFSLRYFPFHLYVLAF